MGKQITGFLKSSIGLTLLACLVFALCIVVNPTDVKAAEIADPNVDLKLNTEYEIPQKNTFQDYSFTLEEATKVEIVTSGEAEYSFRVSKTYATTPDDKDVSVDGKKTVSFVYPKGDYIIRIACRNSSVNLKINTTPYTWGTMELKSFDKGYFTVVYTPSSEPGDNETYISSWTFPGIADFVDGKSQTFNGFADKFMGDPGHNKLTVFVKNDKYDIGKEFTFDAVQKPSAPKYSANYLENVTTNSAIIGGPTASTSPIDRTKNGNYYKVELYKGGKWIDYGTYDASKRAKISKLKPNTTYKVRLSGVLRAAGYEDIVSAPSNAVSFKTGCKEKPSIKSIKVTNVKVRTIPRRYHPGGWSGTVWRDGYYTGGYKETSYNVTVTLKKRVKGPNGLNIDGVYVKGNGKTFKTKGVIRADKKGKKVNFKVSYANHKLYGGKSPAVTKKVTLK